MLFALGDHQPETDGDNFYVAPGAVVIGKVTLGTDANIWPGAVLRGDNDPITIGARVTIQDGCVLHTDPGFPLTLADGVSVGHMAMLHGCTVGENTLIGIGAVVLNGAKIGKNCLIGAKALVTEGKEIPDGSMVLGSPGKVVKDVDTKMLELMRKIAQNYVERAKRYKAELKQIR